MAYWRISIISPEGEEEPLLLNPLLASMSSLRHLILAVFVCEITRQSRSRGNQRYSRLYHTGERTAASVPSTVRRVTSDE
jgi:hypothetical protein